MNPIIIRSTLAAVMVTLSACGGGGGTAGDTQAPLPPTPAPSVELDANTYGTLAGGTPVKLNAHASDNSAVTWKLASGAPGTLSTVSGNSTTYVPPANGVSGSGFVPVIATAGSTSQTLTLQLAPDPGASGLSTITSSAIIHGNQPTMLSPIYLAADGKGAIYVGELILGQSPSRAGAMSIGKINPDGTLTNFLRAGNGDLRAPHGMVADRNGNVFVAAISPSGGGNWAAIYKIDATGTMALFAGSDQTQTTSIVDGKGDVARFSSPEMAGIDPDGNIYLNDQGKVRKVTPDAVVTTVAGLPAALGADLNGNLYKANSDKNTISKFDKNGTETAVAGAAGCTSYIPGPLPSCVGIPRSLVQLDAATYIFIASYSTVVKMVVPH